MKTPDISYREIPLTQGQVAIVDLDDYEFLSGWKWYATLSTNTKKYYAARKGNPNNGEPCLVYMARQLLDLNLGDRRIAEHRNGNTLDNRSENLRFATDCQNQQNRGMTRTNRSGFKGVCWEKAKRKWAARIDVNKKRIRLGYHDTPEQAHAAYCEAARKYHGEFARLS